MFGRFEPLSLILHITQREGRAVEQLLAPRALSSGPAGLRGAVIEASYLPSDPPLLVHLAEAQIPWVVDPQSVRFASKGYLRTEAIRRLPYAPAAPLAPDRKTKELDQMVRSALEFQAAHEPSMYMVPALPLSRVSASLYRVYKHIHEYAADLNDGATVPFRPLLAQAAPSTAVLRSRFGVFERLDRPFAGVYVQPLQLNTKNDSVERLVAYVRFLQHAAESGMPAIAARPGAFGLVLTAFGIDAFDSGLGDRDSFSLSRLDYVRPHDEEGHIKGGRSRRVYFSELLTSVAEQDGRMMLESPALRSQLTCDIEDCRTGGYRFALDNPRAHFYHARVAELGAIRSQGTTALRVQHVQRRLAQAADRARLVNHVRQELGLKTLDFSYLDRWMAVLTRVATPVAISGQ